jgi:hypothetical protein
MKAYLTLLGLALASSAAIAQDTSKYTLDDALTQKEGMTRIDDGLYAQIGDSSESYVATNAHGQRALLNRLQALHDRLAAQKKAGKAPSLLNRAIADISRSLDAAQAKREVTGDCSGPGGTAMPQIYARAVSSGGLNASAYAVRSLDFGPGTPTTNTASAQTSDTGGTTSSQDSTTVGDVAASASVSVPASRNACTANAYATVTCPGHTEPSIRAFATSWYQQPTPDCA